MLGQLVSISERSDLHDVLGIKFRGGVNTKISYGEIVRFIVDSYSLNSEELVARAVKLNLESHGISGEVAQTFSERAAKILGECALLSPESSSDREQYNEQAVQLLSGLALAFHSAAQAEATEPTKSVKFAERDKLIYPTAESFLHDVYRDQLPPNGELTQAALRKIDPQLMAALDNQFRGRRDKLAAILPRKSVESDRRLMAALGYIPQGDERRTALGNLSKGFKPRTPHA